MKSSEKITTLMRLFGNERRHTMIQGSTGTFTTPFSFILAIKKIDTITVGADSRMLIDSVYELDGKEAHITVPDTKCKIRMGDRLSFAVAPIF